MIIRASKIKRLYIEPSPSICIPCKGSKYLCGRSYCPLLLKFNKNLSDRNKHLLVIEGTSPPSIFVGRYNYPKVRIGPLLPNKFGSTELYDIPEFWLTLRIEDILNFRYELIRSYNSIKVDEAKDPRNWIINLQDMLLSSKGVDIHVKLKKNPTKLNLIDDVIPPMGPSAPFENFDILSFHSSDRSLEKVYYDYDLNASEAIIKLYNNGMYVSRISKVLSAGMLGLKKYRKFVPTRWSITAVDDTISKHLIAKLKFYPTIDKIRVFKKNIHLNNFIIIMFPEKWSYEWIEAWYPNTTWNIQGKDVSIESDYESYVGRKDYAKLGGCYYSVRLAVSEYLLNEKRQAKVLAIREILPGFVTSIGVWFVRESVRNILKENYKEFENSLEALNYVFENLNISKDELILKSKILKDELQQNKINMYY